MVLKLLLVIAAAGTLTSTIFLGLIVVSCLRFRWLSTRKALDAQRAKPKLPPVSVLKPLHGDEPQLRENLSSFFAQDYEAGYELLFAARSEDDAGLVIARQLAEEYPQISAKFVVTGEPAWPSGKIYSLYRMMEIAAHEYVIISDSDVRVAPDYLANVIPPLLDRKVGLVTCAYRGKAVGGAWSRLEALGMSVEMSAGVILADMLEEIKFALGPSMSTRRECIEKAGGIRTLADYYADDFVLGASTAAAGYKVWLSHHVIDHCALHSGFRQSIAHQVRWMRSTRFSRPAGHLGTGLTFAAPFAAVAALAIPVTESSWAVYLALWNLLNPVILAAVSAWALRDKSALRFSWAYPVRNLLGFFFWIGSYAGNSIRWGAENYEFYEDGKIRPRRRSEPRSETGTNAM